MKANITQSRVDKATTKPKPYEIRDIKLVGFLIRVQPSGCKTYYCEYRRGARIKIGRDSVFSVKTARIKAKEILADYYQGGEPALVVKRAKEIPIYKEYLEEHYFQWIDANHSIPKASKRRLTVDCGAFSHLRLDEITPQKVEKWRLAKVAAGRSPHTANRCYNALRASLSKAEEWGLLNEHPLRKMKPIKADANLKVRYLSENEEARLRATLGRREECMREQRKSGNTWRQQRGKALMADLNDFTYTDHLMPMVLLSINTGLRRGEVFSLKWRNIDFQLKQLTVEGTNAKSRKTRYVPLNKEAMTVLKDWKLQCPKIQTHVFTNHLGQPFKDIKKSWSKLLLSAEITDFRWHDLRHHFASRLAMKSVDLNTIRELLGHSSYEMTLRYAHLSAGHKAEAVAMLCKTPISQENSYKPL